MGRRPTTTSRTNGVRTARTNNARKKFTDIPSGEMFDFVTRSVPTPITSKQLVFHQYAPVEVFTASNAGAAVSASTFALNGLAGSSTPASLFDMYRIEAVRMSVKPQNLATQVVDPTVTKLVNLYWTIDYNDAVPPTVPSDMTTYENCMVLGPGESGQRTFRPKPKVVVNSAAGTDYMTVEPQWFPCTSDDVLHYGAKLLAPVVNGGQTVLQTWTVTFEFYIAFKNVV